MTLLHSTIGTWRLPPASSGHVDDLAARIAHALGLREHATPSETRRKLEQAGDGRHYLEVIAQGERDVLLCGRRDSVDVLVALWAIPGATPTDPPWNGLDLPPGVFHEDVYLRERAPGEPGPSCEPLIDAPWGVLHREDGNLVLDIEENNEEALRQLFTLGSLVDWGLLRTARGRLAGDIQDFLAAGSKLRGDDRQRAKAYFKTKWHHLSQQLTRWTQLLQQMNASFERSTEMAQAREAKRQARVLLAELRLAGIWVDLPVQRVFISSSDVGFRELRAELRAALSERGYLPVSIEDFRAREQESALFCQEHVVACDAFVLLLGRRYARPWKDTGKSVTHLEWEAAQGLIRIAVVFEGDHAPPEEVIEETQENLDRFKAEIESTQSIIRAPPHDADWSRKVIESLEVLMS